MQPITIIMGYLLFDTSKIPKKIILIVAKYYIFYCSYHKINLSFESFKKIIRNKYEEQELLAKANLNYEKHQKIWDKWLNLFHT